MTVGLTNNGALQHNWTIVEPGAAATASFTAPAAGEYLVIYTVAGHYRTMRGRRIVTE